MSLFHCVFVLCRRFQARTSRRKSFLCRFSPYSSHHKHTANSNVRSTRSLPNCRPKSKRQARSFVLSSSAALRLVSFLLGVRESSRSPTFDLNLRSTCLFHSSCLDTDGRGDGPVTADVSEARNIKAWRIIRTHLTYSKCYLYYKCLNEF